MVMGGCVSVLPKSKPAQLYRFGGLQPAAGVSAVGPGAVTKGPISFEAAASTDRILTLTGQSAAYIEGARWVAPAPVLFDEALTGAFQSPGAPHLIERGASLRAPLQLSLDVQAFEARYDQGPDGPPQVWVQVHAALVRTGDRTVVADQVFSSVQRASDNRVGPIVQAYDAAVREMLTKLTAWAGDKAK